MPSISSKKRMKTSHIVVKMNSFVRFFEEIDDPKNHFEINWPLENINFIYTVGDRKKFWAQPNNKSSNSLQFHGNEFVAWLQVYQSKFKRLYV